MKIKIYLFWVVGLLFITYIGSLLLPQNANNGLGAIGPQKDFNYWLSLAQWDGGNYLSIAKNGYNDIQNFAFFPLYPFLIKSLSFITLGNHLVSAIIISNIFFILFLIKFYNYTLKLTSKKRAQWAFLAFILYPAAFFCLVAYSESLFLFLAVYSLDAIYDKKFLKATIFASLASLTRFIGVSLVVLIPFVYFNQSKLKLSNIVKGFFYAIISSTGILLFSICSYFLTKDPFKFISVQSMWQRAITDPISTVFPYIWSILTLEPRPINDYLDLTLTLSFFTILMFGSKKLPKTLWIFSLLTILIPLYTGTLTSMPRYLLASLGVFIIIGDILEKRPSLRIPILSLMLALECLLASLFLNGYWVA